MIKMMNAFLADLVVASHKVHGLHWYVKGPDFFMAHAKLEELYNELALLIDEVAETMLMADMKPAATLEEFAKLANISEKKLDFTHSQDAFGLVAEDYGALLESAKKIKTKAEEDGKDLIAIKADSFIETLAQTRWMLTQR